ncbi:hypothetical protein RV10_GL003145 [Enterococcus pallens]|nr:hypothetical protein RV10_GL003145 [Enterococcus pallens]
MNSKKLNAIIILNEINCNWLSYLFSEVMEANNQLIAQIF